MSSRAVASEKAGVCICRYDACLRVLLPFSNLFRFAAETFAQPPQTSMLALALTLWSSSWVAELLASGLRLDRGIRGMKRRNPTKGPHTRSMRIRRSLSPIPQHPIRGKRMISSAAQIVQHAAFGLSPMPTSIVPNRLKQPHVTHARFGVCCAL